MENERMVSQELVVIAKFLKMFYKRMNRKKFERVTRVFLKDGVLIWEGKEIMGVENFMPHLTKQPAFKFFVISADAEKSEVKKEMNYTIEANGFIAPMNENPAKYFTQTFQTVIRGSKHKIVKSDFKFLNY